MSKAWRKMLREQARKGVPAEKVAAELLPESYEVLRLYQRKDGTIFCMGNPVSREDAKKAVYAVIECFAQQLDMTVSEFVMNMMRKYHNEESTGA